MIRTALLTAVAALAVGPALAQPNLILTEQGVSDIQANDTLPPLFARAFAEASSRLERSLEEGVVVPLPKDPGGGYTHERHKENYKILNDAGTLYQITGQKKYLRHAEKLLHAYADIYNDLPLHPERKNQGPGKLFWQGLNESVWLVYTIQGYDAIRDDLSEASRNRIESDLLRPVSEFLSTESPRTFQRIHNHGTWAAAAVGMTGYAIGDNTLVERALLGLENDGEAGFLKQLDLLFSPDGYYTEGPYYQRYALMPFVLFGQAIDNNEPERKIFEYRDGILKKAILSTIQQSYGTKFFPINDAIKEKGLDTPELVYGVAAAYSLTEDPGLLSIADTQGATVLTGDGLKVARDLDGGLQQDFSFSTQLLRDGPSGEQGGLAVMRMGDGPLAQTVVAKHTGQGMGHGHFDKLSLIWYDAGREILKDYGAARFLNVPSKEGGRYLPENTSWAKQSIAHNTVVLGEESHFGADWRKGQDRWPEVTQFEGSSRANVVSATIDDAYPDTVLTRTTLQVEPAPNEPVVVIDVVDVAAPKKTTIDLPFYFDGQLTDSSLEFERASDAMKPFGPTNGYQHLWVEGRTAKTVQSARLTWLSGNRFYSFHGLTSKPASVNIVRTGANDPDFNLRSEQGFVLRVEDEADARFVSVLEPHGIYNPAQEFTVQSDSQIISVEEVRSSAASLFLLRFVSGKTLAVGLADKSDETVRHRVKSGDKTYQWDGFYHVFDN